MSWTFIPGAGGLAVDPLCAGDAIYEIGTYPNWDRVYKIDLDAETVDLIHDPGDGQARALALLDGELYAAYVHASTPNRVLVDKYTGSGTSWSNVYDEEVDENGAVEVDTCFLMTNGDVMVLLWSKDDEDAVYGAAYTADGSTWTTGAWDDAPPISIVPLSQSSRQSQLPYLLTSYPEYLEPDAPPSGVWNDSTKKFFSVEDQYLMQDPLFYWRVSGGNVQKSESPFTGWATVNAFDVLEPVPIQSDGIGVSVAIYRDSSHDMYFCYWDTGAGEWSTGEYIGPSSGLTDPYDFYGVVFNDHDTTYIYANFGSGYGKRLFSRDSLLEFEPPEPPAPAGYGLAHSAGGLPGAIRVGTLPEEATVTVDSVTYSPGGYGTPNRLIVRVTTTAPTYLTIEADGITTAQHLHTAASQQTYTLNNPSSHGTVTVTNYYNESNTDSDTW